LPRCTRDCPEGTRPSKPNGKALALPFREEPLSFSLLGLVGNGIKGNAHVRTRCRELQVGSDISILSQRAHPTPPTRLVQPDLCLGRAFFVPASCVLTDPARVVANVTSAIT
jgi:hypothetical protein